MNKNGVQNYKRAHRSSLSSCNETVKLEIILSIIIYSNQYILLATTQTGSEIMYLIFSLCIFVEMYFVHLL